MAWRRPYGNPDKNQGPIVEDLRSLPASVTITTGVGRGFPDLVIGWQGITVLGEVKRRPKRITPAVLELRESQEKFRREWRGGPVIEITDGLQAVQDLISMDCRTPPARLVEAGGYRLQFPNGRELRADSLVGMLRLLTDGKGGGF